MRVHWQLPSVDVVTSQAVRVSVVLAASQVGAAAAKVEAETVQAVEPVALAAQPVAPQTAEKATPQSGPCSLG